MTDKPRLAAIVLAAGDSTRMGKPKQLLPFGPTTLLGHVVMSVEASPVDEVVVVTGRLDHEVREAVELTRSRWVNNPDPDAGTIESLRVGAAAVPDAGRLLVVLGDSVTPDMSDVLVTMVAVARERAGSFMARYSEDYSGHPYLLERELLNQTVDLIGDKRLFSMIPASISVGDAREPIDVNTWEDYVAACRLFGYEPESLSGGPPSA